MKTLLLHALGAVLLLAAGAPQAQTARYCPEGGPIRFAHYEFGLI